MIRFVVDPDRPDQAILDRTAEALVRGAVVIIPTDTLYGLAVDPFNPDAVDRVFALKGRPADRALPLVAADVAQVDEWIGGLSPLASRLASRFWPGPLTLVVPAPPALAAGVAGDRGSVGVRVPAHPVTRRLCAAAGRPLTATSANVSGKSSTDDPDAAAASFDDGDVDILLDAGRTPGGEASTLVDVTGIDARLIRSGAIPWDEVRACAEQR
jgi:L-threonylcarbamoyladenylate synthase